MDLDVAANDIRDRLDRIAGALPHEAGRPQLRKFDPSNFPIQFYGVASRLDPRALRGLIDDQISYRIERIPGVASLDIWGGLEREIQVRVDPARLQALELPLAQVRTALQQANITVPAGDVERGRLDVAIRTPGKFDNLEQIENLVVASGKGGNVRLRQIAEVTDTHERVTRIIRVNQGPGVLIMVRKQAGSNTVEVATQVQAEMQRIARDYPQITMTPIIDQSRHIQNAIDNLGRTIVYGGALAILVLLLFLRSVRGTLVVAVAIPTSLITTFALIYFGGFTLNLMTMGGLALGVGLMVDNAIVVLENISRLREQKTRSAISAAIEGTAQVGPAVIASTVTTLVIFAPMAFGEDMSGEMFRQLAYTVAFALACSLLVALTLVPMLASRLLRDAPAAPVSGHPFRLVTQRLGDGFNRLEQGYLVLLRQLLHHKTTTLTAVLLVFGLSLLLIPHIGTEFMPASDESEVRITVELEPGTRLALLDRVMSRIETVVQEQVPEMVSSYTQLGSDQGKSHTGEMRINLLRATERTRSSEQIAAELRPMFAEFPGATIRTRAGQGLFLLRVGSSDGEPLQVDIRGFDLQRLEALAADVRSRIQAIDGITDTRLSLQPGSPQELMRIQRDHAADLGVSIQDAARTLETAIGGVRAGYFNEQGREYPIRLQLHDAQHLSQSQIFNLAVPNNAGRPMALRNFVTIEDGVGPQQIDRKNQQRQAVVYASIANRDLGSVVADVQTLLSDMGLPEGYYAVVTGEFEDQQEAFAEMAMTMIMAALLVYMVLASLYESLRDPLIVMCTVPLAIIGVNLALLLTGTTFNLQSAIGIIMLIGIVVNNSILIVDEAAGLRRHGQLALYDAVLEAGRRRLRPVLMTTLTTGFAMLPLALGVGEGAEVQAPMARAVIGGLLSATVSTLLVIPLIYVILHRRDALVVPSEGSTETRPPDDWEGSRQIPGE